LIKNFVGVTIAMEVLEPGAVERLVGTMRRVIDERTL
jgi:phenylacetate-CoA ligase